MSPRPADPEVRNGLLRAARDLFLAKGFAGTGIDEICRSAGVTKGALFHHFADKEDLAKHVLTAWTDAGFQVYSQAPFLHAATAIDRALGYVDFTAALSEQAPIGCLIGTFVQEVSTSHPHLRKQCDGAFVAWKGGVAQMLAAAKAEAPTARDFDPESVAAHFVAVFEGAQILAKASQSKTLVAEHMRHFRAYLCDLLGIGERRSQGEKVWPRRKKRPSRRPSKAPTSRP